MEKIVVGNYYRKSNTPNYGWAKVLGILPAHSGVNTHSYQIAKCEWTVSKNDLFGFIKYFKLTDLIEEKPNDKD